RACDASWGRTEPAQTAFLDQARDRVCPGVAHRRVPEAIHVAAHFGPGKADWLDGFDDDVESCSRVVLDGGDGRPKIMKCRRRGNRVWVGSPPHVHHRLRMHHRCDQPMVDISNHIAYDGLIVRGVAHHQ
ncbi:hypothetical protein, partial [Frankia sp. CiP3]|uniref:hypothetical protein n=1 Tax=Frankia sp. CiP3 TaxID=2880971 RepID=UPI001EF50322